jgi:hypothetical protein
VDIHFQRMRAWLASRLNSATFAGIGFWIAALILLKGADEIFGDLLKAPVTVLLYSFALIGIVVGLDLLLYGIAPATIAAAAKRVEELALAQVAAKAERVRTSKAAGDHNLLLTAFGAGIAGGWLTHALGTPMALTFAVAIVTIFLLIDGVLWARLLMALACCMFFPMALDSEYRTISAALSAAMLGVMIVAFYPSAGEKKRKARTSLAALKMMKFGREMRLSSQRIHQLIFPSRERRMVQALTAGGIIGAAILLDPLFDSILPPGGKGASEIRSAIGLLLDYDGLSAFLLYTVIVLGTSLTDFTTFVGQFDGQMARTEVGRRVFQIYNWVAIFYMMLGPVLLLAGVLLLLANSRSGHTASLILGLLGFPLVVTRSWSTLLAMYSLLLGVHKRNVKAVHNGEE